MGQATALLLSLLFAAAQLHAPAAIPNDHGAVQSSTTSGTPRWNAHWTMEPWSVSGKNAVRFTESGEGPYSPFQQKVQWSLESIWLADGPFFPLQFVKTIRDSRNQILAVEKKNFDRTTGKVTFERINEKGVKESASFAAGPDVLTIEGIAGILQLTPFGKSGTPAIFSGHLLSNEPRLYAVAIESRGIERLKTSAGEIECYKLELVPHLGLLNVLKVFYPKTYFWFSVSAPHTWVRYQGLENGPGSPEIVMEAR